MKKIYLIISWGMVLMFVLFNGAMIWAEGFRNWFINTFDASIWPSVLVCAVLVAIFGIPVYIDFRRKKLKKS